jgi:hypothetical protein
VADRAYAAVTLLGGGAGVLDRPPHRGSGSVASADITLQLTVPAGALRAVNLERRDAMGAAAAMRGAIEASVVLVAMPPELPRDAWVRVVETVRQTLLARGGMCFVLRALTESTRRPARRTAASLSLNPPQVSVDRRAVGDLARAELVNSRVTHRWTRRRVIRGLVMAELCDSGA